MKMEDMFTSYVKWHEEQLKRKEETIDELKNKVRAVIVSFKETIELLPEEWIFEELDYRDGYEDGYAWILIEKEEENRWAIRDDRIFEMDETSIASLKDFLQEKYAGVYLIEEFKLHLPDGIGELCFRADIEDEEIYEEFEKNLMRAFPRAKYQTETIEGYDGRKTVVTTLEIHILIQL